VAVKPPQLRPPGPIAPAGARGPRRMPRAIQRLVLVVARRPTMLLSATVLLVFVVAAVFAPQLAPFDPTAQDLRNRLIPPAWFDGGSRSHWLGTDNLGRDILSRLLYGSRVSLVIGIATITFGMAIGALVGMVSGYFGSHVDTVSMRIVDVWMAFPSLLLALIFAAVLGPGLVNLIIALVLTSWPIYTRVIRAEVLSLREREFVTAIRALGSTHARVLIQHVLPNVFPLLLVIGTLQLGVTIITEASLSFLGIGVDPATPTWGAMLSDGRRYMRQAWWLTALPGVAISLVVLAVNLAGDGLRDVLDPRTRV
jgi:ABC-type dipeptide/oligopeptide/nickel transport system permease subunit